MSPTYLRDGLVDLIKGRLAPWPSPRALLVELQHCQLVEFFESKGTFWSPCQQTVVSMVTKVHSNGSLLTRTHPMSPMIKSHSLVCFLWGLSRFFGCHGNGCQGNQSLDIFQHLWSEGPPTDKDFHCLLFTVLMTPDEIFWLPWQRLPRKLDQSIFPVIRVLWATFMPNFMEFGPQTVKIDFGLTFALYYIK